jgi:uncharacterized protein (TIGR02217 family)
MATVVDNVRLPDTIEAGATGGPRFSTTIQESDSGKETAVQNWTYPRHMFDISWGIQSKADWSVVTSFFMARRGKAYGFRFKDFSDYKATLTQIGVGTGINPTFQMVKIYTDAVRPLTRKITRLVTGTVSIFVNAVLKTETTQYTLDYNTGLLTFAVGNIPSAGQIITSTYEFDLPVRFDNDGINVDLDWEEAGTIPSITVREIKE